MSSAFNEPQSELGLGFHYFIYGWRLMLQRQLLPFIAIPIAINVVLMVALLWFFISNIFSWSDWIVSFMPSWLDWLTMIIVPLAILSLVIVCYFRSFAFYVHFRISLSNCYRKSRRGF